MKKTLAMILIILPVLITGCFSAEKISFTDENMSDADKKVQSEESAQKSKVGFQFSYGKISFSSEDVLENENSSARSADEPVMDKVTGLVVKSKFDTMDDFDNYIQAIKFKSDEAMMVSLLGNYTWEELEVAKKINNALINMSKDIKIPENIIKTKNGKYYANEYAKEKLQSLLSLRNELLKCQESTLDKKDRSIEFKIAALRDGSIPIAESAVALSRDSMMDEEGYVWDNVLEKYIPVNDSGIIIE